ncbi:hypothetical protein MACH17_34880 [Phaeobacter inhibens]|nr:hypothetical protein MACH17_34880 [Phaeobacter inhibens]
MKPSPSCKSRHIVHAKCQDRDVECLWWERAHPRQCIGAAMPGCRLQSPGQMPPSRQFFGQLAAERVILSADTNPCGRAIADNQQTQRCATPQLPKPWPPGFRQA